MNNNPFQTMYQIVELIVNVQDMDGTYRFCAGVDNLVGQTATGLDNFNRIRFAQRYENIGMFPTFKWSDRFQNPTYTMYNYHHLQVTT